MKLSLLYEKLTGTYKNGKVITDYSPAQTGLAGPGKAAVKAKKRQSIGKVKGIGYNPPDTDTTKTSLYLLS